MTARPAILIAVVVAAVAVPQAGHGQAQALKFKLKPGASGQLCLDCHGEFAAVLKKASVHTPVKSKD